MLKNDVPNTSAFDFILALNVDAWLSLRRVEGVDLGSNDASAPLRNLIRICRSDSPGFH